MTTETTTNKTYTIDATGKRLGKVATEAASVMLGKNDPTFAKHTMADVQVTIENVSKLDIPERKEGEIYQSYSGYPGGRKEETLIHLAKRLGYNEVMRRSVAGMLPTNKHKKRLLAKLVITE
ncbi:uL13 family ribosomal protein [Candidatus Nomurabacteria bacterium]|nr:uL13 family ribosomal protein [Candidatus Nomurabacteria bacterium]